MTALYGVRLGEEWYGEILKMEGKVLYCEERNGKVRHGARGHFGSRAVRKLS